MDPGLDIAALGVRDLGRAVRFYRDDADFTNSNLIRRTLLTPSR